MLYKLKKKYLFILYILFLLPFNIDLILINKQIINIFTSKKYFKLIINCLKYHVKFSFKQLLFITAVDLLEFKNYIYFNLNKSLRFKLIYSFLNLKNNFRINLIIFSNNFIDSIQNIFYNNSNWYEREIWDMFGIFFFGNIDIRRILTDYGFEGHPLKKDFPLTGFFEIRYNEKIKQIVYEPYELAQEYRFFDYLDNWILKKNFDYNL